MATTPRDTTPPTPGTRPRTVLLVEDNAADREQVRRLFREWTKGSGRRSYRLVEATTGAEGLAQCRSVNPDCVLLDYTLPDMDGLAFLDALRGNPERGCPLPVAMLTARDDDEAAAGAMRRGAQDYLIKDALSAHGLVRAIENAIEKFSFLEQLEAQRAALELRNRRLESLREELQASMRQLAEATKTKDRFLAVMSHEMRTPLNAILGYAELLEMELEGPLNEGQRHQVERIRAGSRHLLELTNDVLDLARADANRLDLDLRPVDLNAVCEEVAALLEQQAASKGIALVVKPCDRPLPLVQADLHRLRQVLVNLVGNAIKFTDKGEVEVRCGAARADGMVTLEIADTGIGIEPEVLPLVFDEFYQAKGDFTRRHGGTGLGLAISRRLVVLMGGEISVSSEPGVGSVFTVALRPAVEGSQRRPEDVMQHGARMASHAASPRRSRSAAIPVVAFGEDAAALAELERRVSPSVRLAWTTDPAAVAKLAAEHRAALVVLDAGSAGGVAWRITAAMQEIADLSSTAVLLLPSLSAAIPDEASQVLDLGWVSLVAKPFTAEQLRRAVSVAAAGGESAVASARDEDGGDEAPPEGSEPHRRGPYDVLVIDDDADSRRVAAKFLADAQVTVREADEGEAALLEMHLQPPDVVVLDLMMPVLDGFGVLAAMRADPLLAGIPVVVLTAKNLTDAERQFLSRTAVRVLQKGAHRLADVAALVLRAARSGRGEGTASGAR